MRVIQVQVDDQIIALPGDQATECLCQGPARFARGIEREYQRFKEAAEELSGRNAMRRESSAARPALRASWSG